MIKEKSGIVRSTLSILNPFRLSQGPRDKCQVPHILNRVAQRFRDILKDAIKRGKFRSYRQFCILAVGEDKCQGEVSYLTKVLSGKSPPPLHRAERWGRALGLEGVDLDRFIWHAFVDTMPDSLREHWQGFYDDHIRLVAQVAIIRDKLKEKGMDL
jgi:hypothetical protein